MPDEDAACGGRARLESVALTRAARLRRRPSVDSSREQRQFPQMIVRAGVGRAEAVVPGFATFRGFAHARSGSDWQENARVRGLRVRARARSTTTSRDVANTYLVRHISRDMQIWVSTFPYFFDQQRSSAGNLVVPSTVRGDPSRKTVFAKNARSATARCYAPNERRLPRDAQLQRGIVILDVNRGPLTAAHVRAGVSTRRRRLEEERLH